MCGALLDLLNSLHANLKFTYELGPDHLAFLDTNITLPTDDCEGFSSSVYRKPSNTNVLLNFNAMCPQNWKLGLITCFINRAYTVCSTWHLFDQELKCLMGIFRSNGYPQMIFDKCVRAFLDKKHSQPQVKVVPVDLEYTPIITIPYTGYPSLNFKKRLLSIFRSVGVNVKITFRSFRVGRYFSLKSATPVNLVAKVIYKFQSSCDRNMSYIGKTKRHLTTRVTEHFSEKSAIFDHLKDCLTCQTQANIDNFSVLTTAESDFMLRIKEALLIKEQKPVLNKQLAQQGSFFFLGIF